MSDLNLRLGLDPSPNACIGAQVGRQEETSMRNGWHPEK